MINFKLETKEYLTINFEKNGASLSALIEDETIYLYSFHSVIENRGYMTDILNEALQYLKLHYPEYVIYADCNVKGMIVSLKCGCLKFKWTGQIRKDIFRIDF